MRRSEDNWPRQLRNVIVGDSPVTQWLGLHASSAEGLGLIPGKGTKILQAERRGQKKTKSHCHKRTFPSPKVTGQL